MKKQNRRVSLAALVLGIGAFFMPMRAYAKTLTPDGQAVVVDYATEEDGKEFYTFSTPEGNVFYLVIDHKRSSDNVYLLNEVTESDLAALVSLPAGSAGTVDAVPEVCSCSEKCEWGNVDVKCPVCKLDLSACGGKQTQNAEQPDEGNSGGTDGKGQSGDKGISQKSNGNTGTMVLAALVIVAVGGGGYYLKVYKPKHELDDADDLDDLLAEQEVNEDMEDGQGYARQREDTEAEPDEERQGYEDYGNEGVDGGGYQDGDYPDGETWQED